MRFPPSIAAWLLTLALAAPALAQNGRLRFGAGGGPVAPAGAAKDRFETGWHVVAGGIYALEDEAFAVRVDYGYSQERLIGGALDVGFVNGRHEVHGLEAQLQWTAYGEGPTPVYLVGGLGLFYRRTAITNIRDYTPGPSVCDPWLQVCAPGPVPVDEVLGTRSAIDPGLALGAGVEIPAGRRLSFFVELRWRFVWGNVHALPGESGERSNSHYFPLTLGVRF